VSLTGLLFLAAFAAGAWLTLFRHASYGLYAYVLLFYLNPQSRWWGENLPDLRWSLLIGILTLLASWRLPTVPGRPPWLRTTPAKAMLLFALWFWLQNLWALDGAAHLDASFLFTKYLLLYYLVYRLVVTPEDQWRFLLVHLAGCAYFGYLAFVTPSSGRLEGVGGAGVNEANAFAMQMSTGVVVAAMVALTAPGARRWFAIASLPFMLNGIIHSGSRGGFLALIAGGMVLWYLKPHANRRLFYVFAILGVLLFGALARDPEFWERMQTMQTAVGSRPDEMDDSALSRIALVNAQIKMAEAYPFGTGHRGTAVLSPQYIEDRFLAGAEDERRRSSHNTFMTALVEQGIPGALIYLWLWLWTLRTVVRVRKADARSQGPHEDGRRMALLPAIAAALAVVFVAGMFVDYIKAEVQIWFWALLASLLVLRHPERPVSAGARPVAAPPARVAAR